MITFDRLREYLTYCPETGNFFANQDSMNAKAGRQLGTKHSTGYFVIRIDDKLYKAHRLAWLYMTGKMPEKCIDHINRNGLDNRWENLREVCQSQNTQNSMFRKTNTSGFHGVSWYAKTQKWRARISHNSRTLHLGYFETKEQAYEAYCRGAAKYHDINPHAAL